MNNCEAMTFIVNLLYFVDHYTAPETSLQFAHTSPPGLILN